MADHNTILAALKANIETVADRGPVHTYIRYAKDNGSLGALFKNTATNRLNGWIVYREFTRTLNYDVGLVRRLDGWRKYGYMAIDDADASANLLQTQLEAIRTAFLSNRTLGGAVIDGMDLLEKNGRLGWQIERVEPWTFAGVLCMRSQCLLTTESEEAY